MKQTTIVLVLILTLGIPIATFAAEADQSAQDDSALNQEAEIAAKRSLLGENLSLTASFKVWRATLNWEYANEFDIESTANMYGPAINFTINQKFYAGISYYKGSGFDFTIENVDFDATKKDFDIWGGYSFHQRGSVFVGYKNTNLDIDNDINKIEATLKGPVLGINGNYPINNSGFIIFGTLGYTFLDSTVEVNGQEGEGEYSGPAIEFGVSYILPTIPELSFTGGYKYQNYTDDDDEDKISFSGLTLAVNYRI